MLRWLVVCACVAGALAAVALAPLEDKPDEYKNVPGCYISELGRVVPVGEQVPAKSRCMSYRCQENSVQWLGCGAVAAAGCRVVADEGRPHPACCPTIECA